MIRIKTEKESDHIQIRMFGNYTEIAYLKLGLSGLRADIEFPSDWHEDRRAWVRLGFGFMKLCFSFPWKWVVPDNYQCSGPTYGFVFFDDMVFIRWGKSNGERNDPSASFYMPWSWRHKEHKILSEPMNYSYTYVLKSGEVQERMATVKAESRLWTRPWFPHKFFKKSIYIEFDEEVGERSGSWKGGCTGCSYDMKDGETPLQTLRRMELERKF
jgi:hypothetical protein